MGTTLQSDDGYVQHDKASLLACPSPTAPTTVSAPAAPLMPPSASSAPPPRPVNSQVPGRVQIYAPKSNVVSDFLRNKYEKDAWKYWDYFYKRNADRFFKDRHYLHNEWGHILHASPGQNDSEPASAPESAPSRGGPQPQVLLEVGCGAGNTVYPLLEANPNARVYACDFSKRAVELVQEHAEFAKNRERLTAFVCDITSDELAESVPPASVDAVTMVFVLSAISPEKMPAVVRNLAQVLKTGGHVLVRDYASGDLAQERLIAKEQKICDNFFVRGDGTRAYYFPEAFLRQLFEGNGYACEEMRVHSREIENRARELKMHRRWIQATFRLLPKGGEPSLAAEGKASGSSDEEEPPPGGRQESRDSSGGSGGEAPVAPVKGGAMELQGEEARPEAATGGDGMSTGGMTSGGVVGSADAVGGGGEGRGVVIAAEARGSGGGGGGCCKSEGGRESKEDGQEPVGCEGGAGGAGGSSCDARKTQVDDVGREGTSGAEKDEDDSSFAAELFALPPEFVINEVRIGRQAQEQGQGQGQEDGQGGHVLKIKSLPKHDQHTQPSTGLLLWDSARALGSVLAAHPSLLAGRSVLELGCGGAAIASFLASKSARKIVATDGDPKALDLLEENLALNRDEFPVDRIQYQQLRWGDAEDIENARTLSDGAGFDVILGADVVYVAEAVPLLFQTSKMLLAGLPSGAGLIPLLILCHITRRVSEGEILSEATKAGLRHVSNDVLESYLHSPLDAEISAHFGNLGQEKTGLLRLLAFQVER